MRKRGVGKGGSPTTYSESTGYTKQGCVLCGGRTTIQRSSVKTVLTKESGAREEDPRQNTRRIQKLYNTRARRGRDDLRQYRRRKQRLYETRGRRWARAYDYTERKRRLYETSERRLGRTNDYTESRSLLNGSTEGGGPATRGGPATIQSKGA